MGINKLLRWGALSLLASSLEASVPNFAKWNDTRLFDARVTIGKNVYKISELSSALSTTITGNNSSSVNQKVVFGYNLPIALLAVTEGTLGSNGTIKTLLENDTTIFPLETSLYWTLLHSAALNAAECVEVLLEDGRVDINRQNHDGDTALMLAIRAKQYKAAEAILKYTPKKDDGTELDLTLKNKKGETVALLIAKMTPGSNKTSLQAAYTSAIARTSE